MGGEKSRHFFLFKLSHSLNNKLALLGALGEQLSRASHEWGEHHASCSQDSSSQHTPFFAKGSANIRGLGGGSWCCGEVVEQGAASGQRLVVTAVTFPKGKKALSVIFSFGEVMTVNTASGRSLALLHQLGGQADRAGTEGRCQSNGWSMVRDCSSLLNHIKKCFPPPL